MTEISLSLWIGMFTDENEDRLLHEENDKEKLGLGWKKVCV